jgi:predicted amidohydrolase
VRIASIQLKIIEDSKEAALDHARELILHCRGADLIILPELWNIGFASYDRYRAEAEQPDGPTITMLSGLAAELRCYIHTGSIVERDGNSYFNASFLLDRRGSIAGSYRKFHLFTFQSAEAEILTPGRSLTVMETEFGAVGMATCYDLRFPEFFRAMVDMGAGIFLVTAAWPYPRLEHWLLFNRVRALENLSFLVSSNSCGVNQGTRFAGHSQVVNPSGNVVAEAGEDESILWADIDVGTVAAVREAFPALKDRVLTGR